MRMHTTPLTHPPLVAGGTFRPKHRRLAIDEPPKSSSAGGADRSFLSMYVSVFRGPYMYVCGSPDSNTHNLHHGVTMVMMTLG